MSTENWLVLSFIYNCILIAYVVWKLLEIKIGEKIIFICMRDKQFEFHLASLVQTAIKKHEGNNNGRS